MTAEDGSILPPGADLATAEALARRILDEVAARRAQEGVSTADPPAGWLTLSELRAATGMSLATARRRAEEHGAKTPDGKWRVPPGAARVRAYRRPEF